MTVLADLGRTVADSADRDSWLAQHDRVIGSSTAGKFARAGSVETYVRQILAPRTFSGNETTANGHRWEPVLLAWAGAEPNSLLVHHPDEPRFAATVDGTILTASAFAICETKTKHNKVVIEPTPYEIRQLAWQLYCLPEAELAHWVWGEVVRDDTEPDGWKLRRDPQTLIYRRDSPEIVAATELIVPIAHKVLAALTAAQQIASPF